MFHFIPKISLRVENVGHMIVNFFSFGNKFATCTMQFKVSPDSLTPHLNDCVDSSATEAGDSHLRHLNPVGDGVVPQIQHTKDLCDYLYPSPVSVTSFISIPVELSDDVCPKNSDMLFSLQTSCIDNDLANS